MVDFSLSADQERVRSQLRTIAVEQLRPLAAEAEAKAEIPETVARILGSVDWLPGRDAFAGGVDDPLGFCLAAEALGWADPALAYAWVTSRQVSWLVAACGTQAQRDTFLPVLAASALAPASLLLFEGFGRSPSELESVARRDGADWVVDGAKVAVGFAGQAQVSVVIARDESGELVGFVLGGELGDSVRFDAPLERRVALQALPFATKATIRGLRVSAESALDRDGLAAALSVCRLAQAAVSLGSAEATTRYAADWGLARTAFGRPLVGFQGVSFVLADLFMEVESARAALRAALWSAADTEHDDEAEPLTSRVVAQVNHLFRDASRQGIELMGVHGVIADHPAERIYRSAGVLSAIDFDPLINPLVLNR